MEPINPFDSKRFSLPNFDSALYICNGIEDFLADKDHVPKGKEGLIAILRGQYNLSAEYKQAEEMIRRLQSAQACLEEKGLIVQGVSSLVKKISDSPLTTEFLMSEGLIGHLSEQYLRNGASASIYIFGELYQRFRLPEKIEKYAHVRAPMLWIPLNWTRTDGIYLGDNPRDDRGGRKTRPVLPRILEKA